MKIYRLYMQCEVEDTETGGYENLFEEQFLASSNSEKEMKRLALTLEKRSEKVQAKNVE